MRSPRRVPQERRVRLPGGARPGSSRPFQRASTARRPRPVQSGRQTNKTPGLEGRKKPSLCADDVPVSVRKSGVYRKATASMGEFVEVVGRYTKPGVLLYTGDDQKFK